MIKRKKYMIYIMLIVLMFAPTECLYAKELDDVILKDGENEVYAYQSGEQSSTFTRIVYCDELQGNVQFSYKVTVYFTYDRVTGEIISAYRCRLVNMDVVSVPSSINTSYDIGAHAFNVTNMNVSNDGSKAVYNFSVTPVLRINMSNTGMEVILPTVSSTMTVYAYTLA